ncbi:Ger(x)C family spore germination protein [Paenibacillus roseipurpureus]|uniref:Ger(X)C family spore germination protein n=1 Tax=Paenibacillus roseopurpureus TaxID=2918901 RepID=A0AA96LL84_9BACL|nr:Ger(x)C family spore germination protein [Paenibacillus sp. MBLB1832]WNR43952.1 Ger(x)C family spore germination protein [Paenibacillus sp. MBLB1832]
MRNILVKCVIGIFLLGSLTGCWDMKTIQDTNYMTAVGFDYKDGKFIVYGQMLDFASVAKQEGGQSTQPPLIWVGKEEGATPSEAFNKLYKTSQQRVFWGHIGAYLFTKRALGQGIGKYTDGSIRYSETRFTQWVYSTDQPIESVFSIVPFFNVSPMSSILMQPTDNYRQSSYIVPRRLFGVVSHIREPGQMIMLPSLDIVKDVWLKNEKPDPKLMVNGAYTLNLHHQLEWFSLTELLGLRWLNEHTKRTPLLIYKEGKPIQNVLIKPKSHIKVRVDGDLPVFDLEIAAATAVAEVFELVDEDTLEQLVSKEVTEEVERTFQHGQNRGADVYGLEHVLYRQNSAAWGKLTNYGTNPLTDYKLGNIIVKVKITNTGMLKMKEKNQQY